MQPSCKAPTSINLLSLRRVHIPSLGASGAVFGIVAGSVYLYPNSRISLIFLPFVSLRAEEALWLLVAFDLCGLLFFARRSGLDHAAHLGGAAFGYGTAPLILSGYLHYWDWQKKARLREFQRRIKSVRG